MPRAKSLTPTGAKPPITEHGTMSTIGSGWGGLQPWSSFMDTREIVLELIWPNSVRTYEQMRMDSQLAALYTGITLPIRRYKWMIDGNGARPEIIDKVSNDFNLDVVGQEPRPRARTRNRFSHDAHLRKAFLALWYGHMFFEQVGRLDDERMWRLRKLAERMPHTIKDIKVAPDGGLVSVEQWIPGSMISGKREMEVDRLVAYVWEGDGGNWVGRSMFRECFRNWLIKDRLLRIDAINHERAGGVPMPIAPDDASPDDMQALYEAATGFRVGESSGGALPPGTKWNMIKSTNSQVIDSVRYHDESMARRVLMMVAMLAQGGTSLGSYALGEVFTDLFALGQEAIANWYRDTTNEHVIEDWVDWNYGEQEEQVPLLVYEKRGSEQLAVADLVSLLDAGLITIDDELEDLFRKQYKLGERGTPREKPNQTPSQESAGGAAPGDGGALAAGAEPGTAPSPPTPVDQLREDQRGFMERISDMFEWLKGNADKQPIVQTQPIEVHFSPEINVEPGKPAEVIFFERTLATAVGEDPVVERRLEYDTDSGKAIRVVATLASRVQQTFGIIRDDDGKMIGLSREA